MALKEGPREGRSAEDVSSLDLWVDVCSLNVGVPLLIDDIDERSVELMPNLSAIGK